MQTHINHTTSLSLFDVQVTCIVINSYNKTN